MRVPCARNSKALSDLPNAYIKASSILRSAISTNHTLKEGGCFLGSLIIITVVLVLDNQDGIAEDIAIRAVNPRPVGRVVGDLSVVLLVLGVPEENGAGDLVLHLAASKLGEGGGDKGRTLAK